MKWLLLSLLLGAALRVPGWYAQEEMKPWGLFETDEEQHVAIAMERYNELAEQPVANPFPPGSFNVRGFGHLTASLLYGWHALTGRPVDFASILLTGRVLATLFSLLLVVIVYGMARTVGLPPGAAGVAALLLAVCDLAVTYGHYALPASAYVCAAYLAALGGLWLLRRPSAGAVACLAGGAAAAIAFKFDVLPALAGGALVVLLLLFRYPGTGRRLPAYLPLVGVAAFLGLFWLLTAGWSWTDLFASFTELRRQNADVVPVDDHLRDNLIAYPLAVMAGIGLPAWLLAAAGAVLVVRHHLLRPGYRFATVAAAYLGGWLLAEFGLLWYIDTAFVRRATVFMPATCLAAAWALHRFRCSAAVRVGVVTWSLGLALVGQYNHRYDTRYAFRDWANAEVKAPLRMGMSGIAVRGLENGRYYASAQLDYFAIHERIASRYLRSLTTPFGVPECCTEVYHCESEPVCRHVQDIMLDRRADFELVKEFAPVDLFPERLLYRSLFGYYETFLGYIRVYRRTAPPAGQHPLS